MVDDSELKEELMGWPKEKLVDLYLATAKDYTSLQNYWMMFIQENYGEETAIEADKTVFSRAGKAIAHRLKDVLDIGDSPKDIAKIYRYSPLYYTGKSEYPEKSENKLVQKRISCTMGDYKDKVDEPYLPCKEAGLALREAIAEIVNPNIEVICDYCPPGEIPEDAMCQWTFILRD